MNWHSNCRNISCLFFLILIFSTNNVFPLDFHIEKQEIYTGYRQSKINLSSKANPDILNLEKEYFDTRYFSEFRMMQGDNISFYSRCKIKYLSSNLDNNLEATFDEAYLSLSPNDNLFIDVGRKNLRWGTAYAWNLMNRFEDENRFVKEDNNFKETYIVQFFSDQNTSYSFAGFRDSSSYVVKYHKTMNNFDWDVFAFNYGNSGIGMSFSTIISDALEVHFEGALQRGNLIYYPTNPTGNIYQWEQTKNNTTLYGQFVVGGQYTTESNVNIILEYFHNSLGMSQNEYAIIQDGVNESISNDKYNADSPWRQFLFDYHTNYEFATFRQNYLFFRIQKDAMIGKFNFATAMYYSLDEGSSMLLPTVEYPISDNLISRLKVYVPIGDVDTEFKRFYDGYGLLSVSYIF